MSDKQGLKAQAPHPQVIGRDGPLVPYALLGIADRFESGAIPAELYNQQYPNRQTICGTEHCIWGWLLTEMPELLVAVRELKWIWSPGLINLFGAGHPSDPKLAAAAIRNYVHFNSERPWSD